MYIYICRYVTYINKYVLCTVLNTIKKNATHTHTRVAHKSFRTYTKIKLLAFSRQKVLSDICLYCIYFASDTQQQ